MHLFFNSSVRLTPSPYTHMCTHMYIYIQKCNELSQLKLNFPIYIRMYKYAWLSAFNQKAEYIFFSNVCALYIYNIHTYTNILSAELDIASKCREILAPRDNKSYVQYVRCCAAYL